MPGEGPPGLQEAKEQQLEGIPAPFLLLGVEAGVQGFGIWKETGKEIPELGGGQGPSLPSFLHDSLVGCRGGGPVGSSFEEEEELFFLLQIQGAVLQDCNGQVGHGPVEGKEAHLFQFPVQLGLEFLPGSEAQEVCQRAESRSGFGPVAVEVGGVVENFVQGGEPSPFGSLPDIGEGCLVGGAFGEQLVVGFDVYARGLVVGVVVAVSG